MINHSKKETKDNIDLEGSSTIFVIFTHFWNLDFPFNTWKSMRVNEVATPVESRQCISSHSMVVSCIDTEEMILSEWHNTWAGRSENMKKIIYVKAQHDYYIKEILKKHI